jgi:hypothetical protein
MLRLLGTLSPSIAAPLSTPGLAERHSNVTSIRLHVILADGTVAFQILPDVASAIEYLNNLDVNRSS